MSESLDCISYVPTTVSDAVHSRGILNVLERTSHETPPEAARRASAAPNEGATLYHNVRVLA